MDMRLIYEKTSSTHDSNSSCRTPFRAFSLLAFALTLAVLSLVAAGPARAAGVIPTETEVISAQPDGAFAFTPATASPEEPASTEPATAITQTSATLNGSVDPNGSAVTACEFEYGIKTTPYENKVPCTQSPASLGTGTAAVAISAPLTGLTLNTTYTFRVREESGGTPSYGQPVTFKTLGTTPTVTAIAPTSGPAIGGTAVKIKGTGFVSGATVTIGSAATSVVVVSETEITAKTAATAAGGHEVVVADANGTSTGGPTYTYLPPPTVSAIEPDSGTTLGGTAVKIKGTGFVAGATVTIGSAATSVAVVSSTEITAQTAATTAGTHEVIVTDADGTSTGGPSYTYIAPPTVTAIEPSSGPIAGGTAVKIKGTGFVAGATVTIGSAATSVAVVSETEITAKTAATTAGGDAVVVTDAKGTSTGGPTYTYIAPPTVTLIEPSAGTSAGGTAVKIKGTGFVAGASVTIGSAATSVVVVSASEITAKTAATAPGGDAVIVADANGTSTGGPTYTYLSGPTISSIEPSAGPPAGGTMVTIRGSGFHGGGPAAEEVHAVEFGSVKASFKVVEGVIQAISPPGTGTVGVTVETGSGRSAPAAAGEFTYEGVPSVTGVEPNSGPAGGGTQVTITGTNLIGAGVKFGAAAAAGVTVNSPTSITATSPPGSGTVYVIVSTGAGTSAAGPADAFTYITSSGGTGGGTNTGPVIKPPSTTAGLPAPALTRTANVSTVVGHVGIRVPGSHVFVTLSSARQIPYGTLIEAVHGEVSVTAATSSGGTERGQFFDGEFVLSQGSNGRVLATLSGGDFSICPTPARIAKARRAQVRAKFASPTHLVRRLWAEGHGNFSTKGRYAGAIVQGAQWLTEDMCEGTLILATRERVEVSDLVRHRHSTLQTGGIYTAKPR